jgi:uncharacterized protein (TIRG00374 family)
VKNWRITFQIILSVAILLLLINDAESTNILIALQQSDLIWLVAALIVKTITLFIHEYRLWLALNPPRPSIKKTMQIGFASGAINLVFPGRAGDIAAVALLQKICNLRAGVAAYAVGMASFFEAAIFGLSMIGMLLIHATEWKQLMGENLHQQTFQLVTLFTFGGIFLTIVIAVIGTRLRPNQTASPTFSPKVFLIDAFQQTGHGLSKPSYILINIIVACVEVWAMIASFALAFYALGIEVPTPWTISGLILGLSAIASIVLPPTYGAGTAAAAVFVLGLFGVEQELALAYSALWWTISQIPATMIGLPCVFLLRKEKST